MQVVGQAALWISGKNRKHPGKTEKDKTAEGPGALCDKEMSGYTGYEARPRNLVAESAQATPRYLAISTDRRAAKCENISAINETPRYNHRQQ